MVDRARVEDFLFEEAALLDEWRLDEWLQLFTEDATYTVPCTDLPKGDPATDLVIINDDLFRLRGRVARLNSRRAHREFPWSRTRRLISNVRVIGQDEVTGEVVVTANFVVYRLRQQEIQPYIGRYIYHLIESEGQLRIHRRRAELDLEALRPHATVSVIL